MKMNLLQGLVSMVAVGMAVTAFAAEAPPMTGNCDEMTVQKDDASPKRERDPRCAELARPRVEEGPLPVSGERERARERAGSPAESPVTTPSPTPSSSGGGRR